MKIFLDSADIDEIKEALSTGILDGVTTNPSKIKHAVQEKRMADLESYLDDLLRICKGMPVSLEVIGSTYDDMLREAKLLFKRFNPVAKNVYIKIPVNPDLGKNSNIFDGLRTIKALSALKIPVNCTLVLTPEQALLAAKAGARFISPFAGRIDDLLRKKAKLVSDKTGYFPSEGLCRKGRLYDDNGILSGIDLVAQCVAIIKNHDLGSEILAASIRNARQVREAAIVGAHIATMNLSTLRECLSHPKSVEGMKGFIKDVVPEFAELVR